MYKPSIRVTRSYIIPAGDDIEGLLRAVRALKRHGVGHYRVRRNHVLFVLSASLRKHAHVLSLAKQRGLKVTNTEMMPWYTHTNIGRKKGQWHNGGSVCPECGVIQSTTPRSTQDEVTCKKCVKLSPLELLAQTLKFLS